MKILTCCKQGLNRSVGLADVLKMHFEPVDVIPVGLFANSSETLSMLCNNWADWIILMEAKYMNKYLIKKVPDIDIDRVLICEVGPDTYGNAKHPHLIDKCWRWARQASNLMGIQEHFKRL